MGDESPAAPIERAIRAVVWLVAAGAALYLALALYLDWAPVRASFAALGIPALAVGVLVASLNYPLRFARWHDLLRAMGQQVPAPENLRVYLGGLALTATPGKFGEAIRSALLLRWRVPVGASLAAFFIDRLTDLVGVLLLAAMTGTGVSWWVLSAAAFGGGFFLRRAFGTRQAADLVDWLGRHHKLAVLANLLRSGMQHYAAALLARRLAMYIALAIAAYGIQAAVFAAYVDRLWPGADWQASIHIFATSTLAGAASMIPGGLGAMELACIAQLAAAGMPLQDATAVTISLRAVTLWFALLLGVGCLFSLRRQSRAE